MTSTCSRWSQPPKTAISNWNGSTPRRLRHCCRSTGGTLRGRQASVAIAPALASRIPVTVISLRREQQPDQLAARQIQRLVTSHTEAAKSGQRQACSGQECVQHGTKELT